MTAPTRPPIGYVDECPECCRAVLPSELHPDALGWFAVYDHCSTTWTRRFDR